MGVVYEYGVRVWDFGFYGFQQPQLKLHIQQL